MGMNGAHSRVDLVPGQGGAGPAQQPGGAVAVGQTRIEPGAHVLGAQDHRLTVVQPGQIGAGGAGDIFWIPEIHKQGRNDDAFREITDKSQQSKRLQPISATI